MMVMIVIVMMMEMPMGSDPKRKTFLRDINDIISSLRLKTFNGKIKIEQTVEAFHFLFSLLEAVPVICQLSQVQINIQEFCFNFELFTTWVGVFSLIDAAVVADFGQFQILCFFLLQPSSILYKVVAARALIITIPAIVKPH